MYNKSLIGKLHARRYGLLGNHGEHFGGTGRSMLPMDVLVNTQSLFAGAKDRVSSVQYSVRRHGAMWYGED